MKIARKIIGVCTISGILGNAEREGGDTRYWNLTVAVRLLLKRLRYVHCEILRLFCYQLHSLLLLFNT